MKSLLKRIVVSILLFVIVFWGSPYIMESAVYDIVARAIELCAAVLAAGCYWIGSRE